MSPARSIVICETKDSLVDEVAGRFLSLLCELQERKDSAHVCLTGGSVGIGILRAVASHPLASTVHWDRIHFWWGDERWLPAGDGERNDQQALDALLAGLPVPENNVHRFAASDEGVGLAEAAQRYEEELGAHASEGSSAPAFDLTFLGVGPDGHVASLFPHFEQLDSQRAVVAVYGSPKPPPERLSLSFPSINGSERVWLALAGADKASALGLALAGASKTLVPAAGVHGTKETVFFVDRDAAADIPRELIAEQA